MFNARRNRVTVTGSVNLRFPIDGKLDLPFDDSAPLRTMRMRGKFHILEEGEEGHQTIVGPHHRCLHDVIGERNVNTRECCYKIWIRPSAFLSRALINQDAV